MLQRLLSISLFICALALSSFAQTPVNGQIANGVKFVSSAPTGACVMSKGERQQVISTGEVWYCKAGTWTKFGDSSGVPGGSAGGALDGTYPNPDLAASVAGDGLAESTNVLAVNVDGSTLETNSDTLRIKDLGVSAAKLAADAVTTAKILDANVTNAKLANSAVTIGSTAVSLGATETTIAGLTLSAPTVTGAITLPDNVRQTFNPGATAAGLNVGAIADDPDTPSNGDLWYDSTANELTARINGANVALGAGGGGGTPGGSNTQLQYNNSSAFGGISGVTSDGTNVTAGSGNLRATSPRITTDISDSNGNELIKFTATGSAVNEFTVTNGATGTGPLLSATGGDTNIPWNALPKGSGGFNFYYNGTVTANNRWNLDNAGALSGVDGASTTTVKLIANNGGPGLVVASNGSICMNSTTTLTSGSANTCLIRDGASVWRVSDGSTGAGFWHVGPSSGSVTGQLSVTSGASNRPAIFAQAHSSAAATQRQIQLKDPSGNDMFFVRTDGGLALEGTFTGGGTTGAQTINKAHGSVNFAAAATSLVVTNSLVTATSNVLCTVQTNDTTMKSVACVPTGGSFTIYANAAATAETKVGFLVIIDSN